MIVIKKMVDMKWKTYCDECSKPLIANANFIQDSAYKYHLSCGLKRFKEKLEIDRQDMERLQKKIDILQPYTKEMICESLEVEQ